MGQRSFTPSTAYINGELHETITCDVCGWSTHLEHGDTDLVAAYGKRHPVCRQRR